MPSCYKCGQNLNPETDYGRQDICVKCKNPTKVCLNCINYDASRYNECKESSADRVVSKDTSNFCDYFKPGTTQKAGALSPSEAARQAAEKLFKK